MSTGTINLANQPKGIYILHLTTSGGSIKKMLVIEMKLTLGQIYVIYVCQRFG